MSGGGRIRRDGTTATKAVRAVRHEDAIMQKSENSNPQGYDDYIASALKTAGGHLSVGRGGFILHYGRGCRLSGYDCDPIKASCIATGLPVIDSRMVDFDQVVRLAVKGPMVAVGEDASPPPWHALSFAPLDVVAQAYRAAGAEVFNIPDTASLAAESKRPAGSGASPEG
jgi:hypothetical protein